MQSNIYWCIENSVKQTTGNTHYTAAFAIHKMPDTYLTSKLFQAHRWMTLTECVDGASN
jgi:hypothetical protein